jgi:hypothetical protein
VDVGEIWAYREKAGAQATPVRIDLIGRSTPLRVRVLFLDDVFEGRETWVPASKLVSYWSALERHDANRAALAALVQQGKPDDPLSTAIDVVEQRFLRHGSFVHTRSAEWGLLTMTRPDLVARDAQLGIDDVTQGAWWHDALCTVPLPTTTRIMTALARVNAQAVLRYVEEEDERETRKMARGGVHGKTYISPEVSASVYEEYTGPFLEILRSWAGEDSSRARDEVTRWKTQAWTLYTLLAETIDGLRRDGNEDAAWRLHKKLYPEARRRTWVSTRELERVRDAARDKEQREAQAERASARYSELGRRTAELEAEIWSDTWRPPPDASA